ncbi:glycoside hydrolase family 3 N-terminal domain-containing protein [Nocardioides sp. Leaf307]|uniref:glycoside hydrolase family 3 N-terminal domain-containing protein n=1 Tax=Nocardioides sp. Leaf307 TaxID=1736331 RepID=UPI001F2E8CF9|nr:glycoside hydrolase family 3 N-terminal domain-containing protein [Nocardioides sp. Leaf307]
MLRPPSTSRPSTARHPRPSARPAGLCALALSALVLAGCGATGTPSGPTGSAATPGTTVPSSGSGAAGDVSSEDAAEPTGWGPTRGEVEQARALVAGWDAERLAGQVVVGRYAGTDPEVAADLVAEHHLAGVSVTAENVVDAAQVRATTAAVEAAVSADGRGFPPVVGVDQEGGLVSHLSGVATDFPAFAAAGDAVAAGEKPGRAVVRAAAEALAMELRGLGFTWVFAPVADVTIGAGDPTIGSRSPSTDPATAALAVAAAVAGYDRAGVVSTPKHFPGHGAVSVDSHVALPELDVSMAELADRDLRPFAKAVLHEAPSIMVSHVAVDAVAPGVPASLAPETYDLLREELGFEGVAITDSLGMGAVAGREEPAVTALAAGADLLLMPADTARAHRTLTRAIEEGRLPRERVEEAASRVVAVQLWQQRVSEERPVPVDAAGAPDLAALADTAAAAAEELAAAAG